MKKTYYFYSRIVDGVLQFSDVYPNDKRPTVLGEKTIHGPYPNEDAADDERKALIREVQEEQHDVEEDPNFDDYGN